MQEKYIYLRQCCELTGFCREIERISLSSVSHGSLTEGQFSSEGVTRVGNVCSGLSVTISHLNFLPYPNKGQM